MLNNLSSNFLVEMVKDERSPIQLMIFHFDPEIIGDVFVSDRDLTIDGQVYEGIVENWGELTTVGAENAVSSTMELTVTLWNGTTPKAFTDYFFYEDPINVFVDIYQGFEGLTFEEFAHVGRFVVQDPLNFSEASALVDIDLVTSNMRYFAQVGEYLTKEKFPNALSRDINKPISLIIGDAGEVDCLCIKKPPVTSMLGSILTNPTKVYSNDDLDELNFPQNGFIQIDDEIMEYENRSSNYFPVVGRGLFSTEKSDHSDGSEIIQAQTTVEYSVGQGPITNINNVKVKGQTPTIAYEVFPGTNPAKIVFQAQPLYADYSKGARTTEEFFDSPDPSNTALNPEYAYDIQNKALGAIVTRKTINGQIPDNLAVLQATPSNDQGQIVNVFLRVDHWATKAYQNDRVDVLVEGISGSIGWLNRPNEKDIFDLGGEVDLDHEHKHKDGGVHDHGATDPGLQTINPRHLHDADVQGAIITDGSKTGLPYSAIAGSSSKLLPTFYYGAQSNILSQRLHIRFTNNNCEYVELLIPGTNPTWYGATTVDQWFNISSAISSVQIRIGRYIAIYPGSDITINELTLETTLIGGVKFTTTGVNTSIIADQNTEVLGQAFLQDETTKIKQEDDVDPLEEENRQLITTLRENASRSVTQRFDITDHLETINWDWMSDGGAGRKVSLEYKTSASPETPEIVVTYISFEIEYRQREIKTTDEITCSVVNNEIENRPDAVIQYLLTQKAGVPESTLGSVYRTVPKWDDLEIWDDLETWLDEGQVSGVPDGALFEEAGAWFDFHNYKLNGVLDGDLSVKDAVQKIAWQTRCKLIWQNAKAKLVVLRETDDWLIAKNLSTNDIQLGSFSAKRSPVDDIINKIDIFHTIDRLSDAAGSGKYKGTTYTKDVASISKHGERVKPDFWLFDLIREEVESSVMTESIAKFYIWLLGESSTYYSFNGYLNNYDIEKDDYITVSSYRFQSLDKLPVVVKELSRVFGSGKNSQINILSFIAQSIRHKFLRGDFKDNVIIADDVLQIDLGPELSLADEAVSVDSIYIEEESLIDDEANTGDSLLSVIKFNPNVDDSVSFAEDFIFDIEMEIDDLVSVAIAIEAIDKLCMGSCGFGAPNCEIPFGSKTVHSDSPDDQTNTEDTLFINMGVEIDSEFEPTDVLIMSDGFGCPSIGDGFGVTPFGDEC